MSGFSTLIFFTERFSTENLVSFLNLTKQKYLFEQYSEDYPKTYSLWIKEEIQTNNGLSYFEENVSIQFFNSSEFEQGLIGIYDEDIYQEILKIQNKFTFIINIDFMRSNIETRRYMIKLLSLLNDQSSFYFLNKKAILVDFFELNKYVIKDCNLTVDTVFFTFRFNTNIKKL